MHVLYLAVCVLQTGNGACVVFKDHPPEVCHCAAEWGLAHDELLAAVMPLFKRKREEEKSSIQYFIDMIKGPFHKTVTCIKLCRCLTVT